jgi:signal transduction histidine kinase/DNA-binding response OmpR family regulator
MRSAHAAAPPSAAGPVVLSDTAVAYSLGRSWSILTDRRPEADRQPLTLAQVQAAPYAGQFVPSTEAVPNRDNDPADYWLRCQVRSDAHRNTVWLFDDNIPNEQPCEVLLVEAGRLVFHQLIDENQHWQSSHAVPSRALNIHLPLVPGHTYTLYVHGRSELFWYSLVERTHYLQRNRLNDVEAAAYFGLLLGLVVYNLLLFFSVRDRSYLYYVAFTLSFALLQFHMMGYMPQFWLHRYSGETQTAVQHLLLGLTMAASVQTARSFLDTERLLPRLDRLLRAALWLAPLPLLSIWLPGATADYASRIAPLLLCVLLMWAGVRQLLAGYRPARYFMAGWLGLMTAIVLYYLRTLNLLPVSIFTEYGVRVTSALEVILLSLGLADRINRTRQESQVAQREAMTALQEKEVVQQRANAALSLRAQELQHAYQELQESLLTTGRLQELDELKTRFFTNISHELRTPLTLILGPLDELITNPVRPEPAALASQHALMHRHAARLLELINQLLDITRLEAGQLRLRATATNLTNFVQSSVSAFDSLAVSRGLSLRAVVPPAALWASVDPDQLDKVLTNLLGNALKFTPAGGKVQVRLSAEPNHAVLTVADTGPGIPAAHIPLIFNRFHQVDDSASRRHSGSGIGLALVKELVALHQGTVVVESTEGMGTTFTVRLPLESELIINNEELRIDNKEEVMLNGHEELLADNEEAGQEVGAEVNAFADTNSSLLIINSSLEDVRPLILVVDDHADMRAYVANCLGSEFRIMTAEEGEAGLARITETVPDLVVSDLMMPVLDGLELCRRIKTNPATSHIPVVLLTARTGDDSRLASLELGADDYLTKPFRPQELQARVRNLLRQRELLRTRFAREVTLQPREISITSADEAFLNRALAVVEKELANAEFDVEQFAAALHLSRIQLYRKLKALTDQSPTDFIRTLRLRRAGQLLAAQAGNVADIAYQVGFNNLSYFSKCFREQFGHVPSEHAASVAG